MVLEGMTEKELLELCNPERAITGNCPWIYWTSELYGHGRIIREYAFYPRFLPLIAYSDHGLTGSDVPYKHELETDAPIFLTYSKKKAENFKKLTGKKSYILLWPDIYYRRKNNIQRNERQNGTIAFANHGTPDLVNGGDLDAYARALKKLPEKYQPVTVCLHMHDINNGEHQIFMKHHLPVVTAGNTSDIRFTERLYRILKNYSYATSNAIGTYSVLSIEMGIPFFIYGEPAVMINKSDPNYPIGACKPFEAGTLFEYLYTSCQLSAGADFINKEVKNKVEHEVGVHDSIGRIKLFFILWFSFLKWFCKRKNLLFMIAGFRNRIIGIVKKVSKVL